MMALGVLQAVRSMIHISDEDNDRGSESTPSHAYVDEECGVD